MLHSNKMSQFKMIDRIGNSFGPVILSKQFIYNKIIGTKYSCTKLLRKWVLQSPTRRHNTWNTDTKDRDKWK